MTESNYPRENRRNRRNGTASTDVRRFNVRMIMKNHHLMNTQEKTETRDRDSNRESARKLGTCNTYHTRTSNQKALNVYNCQNTVILKHKLQKWGNY